VNFDVTHLALSLEVDEDTRSVRGTARLVVRPFPVTGGLSEVVLDAAELDVTAVRLMANGARSLRPNARASGRRGRTTRRTARRSLRFTSEPQVLRVKLDRSYAVGETFILEIDYAAHPRKGLFFIQPDEHYPQRPRQVWSQGQAEDNHYWFPCLDGPDTKLTSELAVTVQAGRVALSNGTLVRMERNRRAGTVTYHWRQDTPHPSYLIMLVVGDYAVREERRNGVPLSYYEYAGRERECKRLFAKTAAMVRHFSSLFGRDFPWAKYAQVLLHDFTFGGMENTSATTLTDRALLDERALADFDFDGLIAHELGHQWWGDLVTCRSWSEAWLNEGFATYCERLWAEKDEGDEAVAQLALEERNQYMLQDAKQYRRPIATRHYEKANELFDRHLYEKGGLVLHMLRHLLGDEGFFASLRAYVTRNEYRLVDTHDLEAAVREATGSSLPWFFEQWIRRAGYPELRVTRSWDAARRVLTLHVEQTQRVNAETPVFRFPLDVEIATGSGRRRGGPRSLRLWVEKRDQSFHIPLSAEPVRVAVDPQEVLLKTLVYDRPTGDLIAELSGGTSLLARVRAARELAQRPGKTTETALGRALARDASELVRVAAAISLADLASGTQATAARESATRALRGAVRDSSGRVRRAALWGLGKVGVDDLETICERVIQEDPSYIVVAMAVHALAHGKTGRAFEIITSALGCTAPMEIVRGAVFDALSILRDQRGLALAVAWTAYGRPVGARDAAARAVGALGKHAERSEQDRARECLVALLDDPMFRMRIAAARGLATLGQKAAIDALRAAERRECLDQTVLAMRDAARELEGTQLPPSETLPPVAPIVV
jgi:aminopeptidase N